MIQRIQSIYLLVVTVILVITACHPLGVFSNGTELFELSSTTTVIGDTVHSNWGLLAILVLSALVAAATIFLFKNRVLQIRMTIFNSLILIGFYLVFAFFYFKIDNDTLSFSINWTMAMPLVGIILNYLAIRAIGRDEFMVKAADRLR